MRIFHRIVSQCPSVTLESYSASRVLNSFMAKECNSGVESLAAHFTQMWIVLVYALYMLLQIRYLGELLDA